MNVQTQPGTAGMPSIGPALAEAERVVRAAIQHYKLTVDPARLLVSIQPDRRDTCSGWFAANRWSGPANELLHEVVLAAERLCAAEPAEVLLHELVHAEDHALGVRDCAGRRHNLKFKRLAERLGLIVNERADSRLGFGITQLGPVAQRFLDGIGYRADVFNYSRLPQHVPQRSRPARRRWECPCGNTLRHMKGGVQARCSLCDGEFVLVTDDDAIGMGLDGALDL